MAVLTEQMLRKLVRENKSKTIYIDSATVLTPSAREYINDQALVVVQEGLDPKDDEDMGPQAKEIQDQKTVQTVVESYPYRLYGTEARLKEKPEFMTILLGQDLVDKDHPRIRFRGQIDSLEARLLLTIGELKTTASEQVIQGLKEIYQYTRQLLRSEETGDLIQDLFLLGKDSDEIKEITRHPEKYFNQGHLILEGDEKIETLKMNCLRARIREIEVSAVDPFSRIPGQERPDLLKALNRLSSAVHYLMYLSEQGE